MGLGGRAHNQKSQQDGSQLGEGKGSLLGKALNITFQKVGNGPPEILKLAKNELLNCHQILGIKVPE